MCIYTKSWIFSSFQLFALYCDHWGLSLYICINLHDAPCSQSFYCFQGSTLSFKSIIKWTQVWSKSNAWKSKALLLKICHIFFVKSNINYMRKIQGKNQKRDCSCQQLNIRTKFTSLIFFINMVSVCFVFNKFASLKKKLKMYL